MHSLKTCLALLALGLQLGFAAPLDGRSANGLEPDQVAKRASGTTTASVSAPSSHGSYVGPVQIDGKTYNVIFDTGSTSLWIKGKGNGPSFGTITYGSGSASGTVAYGDVTIGGITLKNQSYGLASSTSGESNVDGIFGLRSASTQLNGHASSVVSNLMPLLKEEWLGIDLSPSVGEFAFGWADQSDAAAPLTSYPVDKANDYGWFLEVSSFSVPKGDTEISCDIDSGTTDVFVPQSVAEGYWSQVPGATTSDNLKWQFPCKATLPDFEPVIGGNKIVIPGEYSTFANNGEGTCYSRLKGSSEGCILGESFYMGQYVLLDYAKKQIGLAPRK